MIGIDDLFVKPVDHRHVARIAVDEHPVVMDCSIPVLVGLSHEGLDRLKVLPEFVIAAELGQEHDVIERQQGTEVLALV